MSRGKHFGHKKQGHQSQPPAYGREVHPKNNEIVEYSIQPAGSADRSPVEIVRDKG
ncbi:hypothetical protein [Metabacillus lacus]|uniref:hypothetical protein n=1 Tax=Metabacillus lacus TaxID=1983721 RepID=UPI0014789930|nr:hypothetical protein [Metabacillus lacus]